MIEKKRLLIKCIGEVLIISSLAISAYGQNADTTSAFKQPIQEFFLTEAVYPQEQRELQITPGIAYQKYGSEGLLASSALIEFGITDRVLIESEVQFAITKSGSLNNEVTRDRSTSSIEVGALYNLINTQKQALSISVGAEFSGNQPDSMESAEMEWESTLIYARQIGLFQTHFNLSREWTTEEVEWQYGLAIVYSTKGLNPTLELNNSLSESDEWYVTPGVVLVPTSFFQFGMGVPFNLSNSVPEWGLKFSLTVELELFEND